MDYIGVITVKCEAFPYCDVCVGEYDKSIESNSPDEIIEFAKTFMLDCNIVSLSIYQKCD